MDNDKEKKINVHKYQQRCFVESELVLHNICKLPFMATNHCIIYNIIYIYIIYIYIYIYIYMSRQNLKYDRILNSVNRT